MSLPTIPRREYVFKNKHYPRGKLTLMPFTAGHESLFLQVKDSEDVNEKFNIYAQVIEDCVKENINARNLPLFLLEDLFARLRTISIGEVQDLQYRCKAHYTPNEGEDQVICNNTVKVKFDWRKFTLTDPKGHQDVFMLTDTMGIKMKYPTIESYVGSEGNTNDMIISCIDSIFDGDEVYDTNSASQEELLVFVQSMELKQKLEIKDKFLDAMPHLYQKIETTCTKCKHKDTLEFYSLKDVFH